MFVACLCLIVSCGRTTRDRASTVEDTLLNNAKDHFERNVRHLPANGESILPGKISTIAWKHARIQELSPGMPVVIVPLLLEGNFKVKSGSREYASPLSGNLSLFIFRDQQKSWHTEVVISVPDTDSRRFTGLVMVEDWQGNALRTLQYENGKKSAHFNGKLECIPTEWLVCTYKHCRTLYTSYNCIVKSSGRLAKNRVSINYGAGVRAAGTMVAQAE